MSKTENLIKHKAFVKEIKEESVIVTVITRSACSQCHVKGACNISDIKEKEAEIAYTGNNLLTGQEVTVVLKELNGLKALFYGYLFPFILILLTLVIVYAVSGNEVTSGLVSLGILIPYYITLYFLRDYLKKVFKFELDGIN